MVTNTNHEEAGGKWKIQFVNHFAVDLLSISELTVIPVIMKFIVNGEIMLLE